MSKKPIHILRYGTVAEKTHLGKAISVYDYLGINGNTAAYVSTAIAKFIVEKFFSKPNKGFFIDPITYAFQKEIRLLIRKSKTTGEERIKKSIEKLANIYMYPANNVLKYVPIEASDFSTDQLIEDFCKRVLDFQYNIVQEHIAKNELDKYLKYVTQGSVNLIPQLRPKFLIAPYFYLDSQDPCFEDWIKLNKQFINVAMSQSILDYDHVPVFAQIVINKNILMDKTKIEQTIDSYSKLNCNGYTIWVDDLNEHEATACELRGFMDLIGGLSNKPIYNMYGGYFSILLTHRSISLLEGVSHGLEYGESRQVYPVGGGIPVSKYYYFPLHQRFDFTKAFYLLQNANIIDTSLTSWGTTENYYKDICECSQCRKVLQDEMVNFVEFESTEFYEIHKKNHVQRRKKATRDTKENCLYHYLLCKKKEFLEVGKKSIDELIKELAMQKEKYQACDALQDNELDYLDIWARCLDKIDRRK